MIHSLLSRGQAKRLRIRASGSGPKSRHYLIAMTSRVQILPVAILLACYGLSAQQADQSQTDALSRRAAERLKTLHDESERLALQEKTVLGELRKLEVNRQIRSEELRQAEASAAHVAMELRALDRQIGTLAEQVRNDIPDLHARLVSLYKLGSGGYVRLLLSTTDVRQFGQATRLVLELADQDKRRIVAHPCRLERRSA